MEVLVKINNQTAGRDKIARLLQYLSRLIWHNLQKNNKLGVDGFKSLEFQLSTFRKLLRFGRCVDVLYSATALLNYPDTNVRFSVILSKISNALFLLADHVLWLGRADICNINTSKWSTISNKYWLYSITMNLVRDFYEIMNIIKLKKTVIVPKGGVKNINDLLFSTYRAFMCVQKNRDVLVDTIKNSCDFFIPLTALGHVTLSPGTVGLLGVISSLAGLIVLVEPLIKLNPM